MRFSIIKVEELIKRGFETSTWRKSNDGLYALVHTEHVELAFPELTQNSLVYREMAATNPLGTQTYYSDSSEFNELLASENWTPRYTSEI